MLPFSDPLSARLLSSVPEEKLPQSWWLIQRDGTPLPGNNGGGIGLLSAIQVTRPLGHLLAFLHLSPLVNALDRRFAVWRRWLSKYVPDGSVPRRFP